MSTQTNISIHPPRVGWDRLLFTLFQCGRHFNPPTPCGVGPRHPSASGRALQFQSTHPVWGGTREGEEAGSRDIHFNPPTPCGVGRP